MILFFWAALLGGSPDDLVRQLADEDPERREEAAGQLLLGDPSSLRALAGVLGHPDPEVVAQAKRILELRLDDLNAETVAQHPWLRERRLNREFRKAIEAFDTALGPRAVSGQADLQALPGAAALADMGDAALPLLRSELAGGRKLGAALALVIVGTSRCLDLAAGLVSDATRFTIDRG